MALRSQKHSTRTLNFLWNVEGLWAAKTTLRRKSKAGTSRLPLQDSASYRNHSQDGAGIASAADTKESRGMSSHEYGQATFSEGAKTTQQGKDSPFCKLCGETGYPYAKDGSWTPTLHHTQKLTQNELRTSVENLKLSNAYKQMQRKCFVALDVAIISWIFHQKCRQQEQK